MEEIRNFDRKLKKVFKKLNRQHEGEFVPCSVNLLKWCEKAEMPQNYNWIVNLLFKECDEDETCYDYIKLDSDFIVNLDQNGVFLFSDVLADFFGLDNVRRLWRYMSASDKYERTYYDVEQCTHTLSDEELESVKGNYMHPKNEYEEEVCKRILGIINAEQERRKHPIKAVFANLITVKVSENT
ncbi:MAG: hypothetical protein K2J47_04055 [Ruminococcus sp.]|nr:hypothetical protein [Ruminococcus sp.]